MGIFDRLFKKKVEPVVETLAPAKKPARTAKKKPTAASKVETVKPTKAKGKKKKAEAFDPIPKLTANEIAKAAATAKGEPWVSVTSFDLDVDRLADGSFSLDWNDLFVARLIRAGYAGKTDEDIVDLWFQDICRNIIQENYEQEMSDPLNRDR